MDQEENSVRVRWEWSGRETEHGCCDVPFSLALLSPACAFFPDFDFGRSTVPLSAIEAAQRQLPTPASCIRTACLRRGELACAAALLLAPPLIPWPSLIPPFTRSLVPQAGRRRVYRAAL